jgi:alkanesulfonate monooxygenase SsuD/methylene tetrahydromethanopterin reductase-like flavin-dependent oxidoreductase (luciferase family)
VLAVALREVDTIEVATGVMPIQVQHPMHLAQRALTVSLIGGGRFILGLGMSHRMVTEEMWGISWDKPVRRLSEYLDGLLPLLAGNLPTQSVRRSPPAGRCASRARRRRRCTSLPSGRRCCGWRAAARRAPSPG